MANFCSKCGNKLNETDNFCPKCGYKIMNNRDSADKEEQVNNNKNDYISLMIDTNDELVVDTKKQENEQKDIINNNNNKTNLSKTEILFGDDYDDFMSEFARDEYYNVIKDIIDTSILDIAAKIYIYKCTELDFPSCFLYVALCSKGTKKHKMLMNAINSYAKSFSDDEIPILLFSYTGPLSDGKEGLLISNKNLYFKNGFIPIKDVRKIEMINMLELKINNEIVRLPLTADEEIIKLFIKVCKLFVAIVRHKKDNELTTDYIANLPVGKNNFAFILFKLQEVMEKDDLSKLYRVDCIGYDKDSTENVNTSARVHKANKPGEYGLFSVETNLATNKGLYNSDDDTERFIAWEDISVVDDTRSGWTTQEIIINNNMEFKVSPMKKQRRQFVNLIKAVGPILAGRKIEVRQL